MLVLYNVPLVHVSLVSLYYLLGLQRRVIASVNDIYYSMCLSASSVSKPTKNDKYLCGLCT